MIYSCDARVARASQLAAMKTIELKIMTIDAETAMESLELVNVHVLKFLDRQHKMFAEEERQGVNNPFIVFSPTFLTCDAGCVVEHVDRNDPDRFDRVMDRANECTVKYTLFTGLRMRDYHALAKYMGRLHLLFARLYRIPRAHMDAQLQVAKAIDDEACFGVPVLRTDLIYRMVLDMESRKCCRESIVVFLEVNKYVDAIEVLDAALFNNIGHTFTTVIATLAAGMKEIQERYRFLRKYDQVKEYEGLVEFRLAMEARSAKSLEVLLTFLTFQYANLLDVFFRVNEKYKPQARKYQSVNPKYGYWNCRDGPRSKEPREVIKVDKKVIRFTK